MQNQWRITLRRETLGLALVVWEQRSDDERGDQKTLHIWEVKVSKEAKTGKLVSHRELSHSPALTLWRLIGLSLAEEYKLAYIVIRICYRLIPPQCSVQVAE